MIQLDGIIPPMVTPFDVLGEVDEKAVRSEARFMLECGVRGVVVCGSTGEGYAMEPDEIQTVCKVVVDTVGDKIPVIAAVIANSSKQAVKLGLLAKGAGAVALQVTPPHYIFKPTLDGLFQYYKIVGEETKLPILVYNVIPWNYVNLGGLTKLAQLDCIIGIKQSAGDIHLLANILSKLGDRLRVFSAVDDLLMPCFILGAHGAISASSTVLPRQSVELFSAVKRGDLPRATELHQCILEVWNAVNREDMPCWLKTAINLQGRNGGYPRSPLLPLRKESAKIVEDALLSAKVIRRVANR